VEWGFTVKNGGFTVKNGAFIMKNNKKWWFYMVLP